MEKPLFTSGRTSRNSMRQEDTDETISDDDTYISVPSIKDLTLRNNSESALRSTETSVKCSRDEYASTNNSELERVPVLTETSEHKSEKTNVPSIKSPNYDSSNKERIYNNKSDTLSKIIKGNFEDPKKLDDSAVKSPSTDNSITDNNKNDEIKTIHKPSDANNESSKQFGEQNNFSVKSKVDDITIKDQLNNIIASENGPKSGEKISGNVLEDIKHIEVENIESNINENFTYNFNDEKNSNVIQCDRPVQTGGEISNEQNDENNSHESDDSAESDAFSAERASNNNDYGPVNQSESEVNDDDDSSNSDVNSCFGDDEIASHSSVEHWTELEVEKDMIDKLVIHKADGEPVVNLEIIRQIRRGEFRTDSELSDKSPREGIKFEKTSRNGSKSEITKRKDSKSFNKAGFLGSHVDNKNETFSNKSKKNDNNAFENNNLIKECVSGVNSEVKPESLDKRASIDGTESCSSGDTDDSVSDSSETSDSETTSLKSSQTGKSSIKDGRANIENKQGTSFRLKNNKNTRHLNTSDCHSQENIHSGIDSIHVEKPKLIENKGQSDKTCKISKKTLLQSNTKDFVRKTDKNLSVHDSEKMCSTKTTSTTDIRRNQIAKLKQIYRQKTQLKDNVQKSNSNILPKTNTPKKSLPYSMNQVSLHYHRNGEERNSIGKQPTIVNKEKSPRNIKQRTSLSTTISRDKNDKHASAILSKRKDPTNKVFENKANIQIEYIDLNSKLEINRKETENSFNREKQHTHEKINQSPDVVHDKSQNGLQSSKSLEDKSINRFHKQLSDICNKDVSGGSQNTNHLQQKQKVDRRFEITINEMFALHGGSSIDTNDSDFAVENNPKASKADEIQTMPEPELPELPSHVTQALIADMPIQKLSADDIARPSSTQLIKRRTNTHSPNGYMKTNNGKNSKTSDSSRYTPLQHDDFPKQHKRVGCRSNETENNTTANENDSERIISSELTLLEKRKRLQASKTYENLKDYKLSESHVTVSSRKSEQIVNEEIKIDKKPKDFETLQNEYMSGKPDDTARSIVEEILDAVLHQLFNSNENRLDGPTKRCTTLDDEGNEVLCCILQAPENKVDPSTFTCEAIDPLEVSPIIRRHEFLISHVIKISTYNVGHIAREREMVAKIPIAHYFVEPWQEVVIREVDKSGHWFDTGEDVDIVQIPDMGNVVYGVQIFLKELTYVAVVTRPRITTLTLEHRDKIISSPSDDRVKLRVPGTSDPRSVSLQSIPVSEKIIKDFENTRGPEVTSYLTAASPMVILSLEGPHPESFSFAVPFTHVNYLENEDPVNSQDNEDKQSETSDKKDEEAPNVPPRVKERMELARLQPDSNLLENKMQKHSAKSQLQELETKVHKREKERYLVLLGDGHDRSVQIKLLDDADRVKSFDIETLSQGDEFVKFSVYDTYARLFAIEVHDIVNFQEIQSTVKGLANYLLKHRVRINVYQDRKNLYNVKFTARVDQPYRQKWPRERHHKDEEENNESVRYLEMNEGDAIGLTFRGNIEVTNQVQRVFSFHGYCGIYATFDLKIKDSFSQKSLPEFHGAVQVYTLKRPRMISISTTRVQNVSADWDLFAEYHFLLPKLLKKTPIIVNRAPISLRFQEPLTVEFVRLMCRELVKDWDTFAFSLGISTARIQAIKQHNRNQISERVLMDVIVCWMKQQPMSRDKVGPILSALRMCRKPHLENELTQRYKALKDSRAKTARGGASCRSSVGGTSHLSIISSTDLNEDITASFDKHIQRAALSLSSSRAVSVRWRQLAGYLLHLELNDVRICDITSEIEEKYKNDATKCYHALQYWNSVSGSPTIWKIVDALRHCNCHVAANTLRVQEQKRR